MIERSLRGLLPGARVYLSGSSCVSGLEPDDLDLVALAVDVNAAVGIRAEYPPLYADEWRDGRAAFREPGPPQVDVVLTQARTPADKHHRLAWAPRKREFFERLVTLL